MVGPILLASAALAAPHRLPPPRRPLEVEPGRLDDVLIVKLVEGHGPLPAGLADSEPLFSRSPEAIRADRRAFDPEGRLADLTLYRRLVTPDAAALGTRLLADPAIELAYLAFAPMPPPVDIAPQTPDFTAEQTYLGPAPHGLGFDGAASWPGGTGAEIAVADLEYGVNAEHEDLDALDGMLRLGADLDLYPCHGTGVFGELFAGDNGYGVVGMVPDAEPVLVYPFDDDGDFDLAAQVDAATAVLDAGDVLLIEQQAYALDGYAPVEVDPAVFDAIALAVAKGIVVVEPSGNGGQDLDAPGFDGWFDRELRDSGAILVGGGASPFSGYPARSWYPWGSCHGDRVDMQGWYDSIATPAHSPLVDSYCPSPDLFFPDGDGNQAYTSGFGGTSGASPMIAAAAAVAQSVAIATRGVPWEPMDLRAALVSTGTAQEGEGEQHIGPQPDMRAFLWTWGVR
jgi:serine protease